MKRLVVALIAALGLLGCKSAPTATDPFMRTTVPPPGTGATDPYYPSGAPPAATPPLPNGLPPNTPPPAKYVPPGGNIYFQQSKNDKSSAEKPEEGSLASALESGPNTFEAMAAKAKGDSETPDGSPLDNEDDELPTMRNSDQFKVAARQFEADNPVKAETKAAKKPVAAISAAKPTKSKAAAAPKAVALATAVEPDPSNDDVPQVLPPETEVFRKMPDRLSGSSIRLASATSPVTTEEEFAPASDAGPSENVVSNEAVEVGEDNGTEIRILSPAADGHSGEHSSLAISETPPVPSEAPSTRQETALVVRNPRNFTAAPPTEITDLPKPAFRPVRKDVAIVQASHSMAIASDNGSNTNRAPIRPTIVGSAAAVAQTTARYAHGPSYEWLHGRLEYSQGSKQWKIRYIPIDGQTDDYGGSVVLKESPALEGFKAGDFVAIQGTLGQSKAARGFSPTYNLRLIEPLRQ